MCRPETLHHNDHGYVAWCRSCNYLSVAFGTAMIALRPQQSKGFIKVLAHDLVRYEDKVCDSEKAFIYNTDSPHVRLVLSYNEVEHLHDLLVKSLLLYDVNRLMDELPDKSTFN